jgi:hypothetical protein
MRFPGHFRGRLPSLGKWADASTGPVPRSQGAYSVAGAAGGGVQVGWCGAHMSPNGMAIRRRARAAVSCSAPKVRWQAELDRVPGAWAGRAAWKPTSTSLWSTREQASGSVVGYCGIPFQYKRRAKAYVARVGSWLDSG